MKAVSRSTARRLLAVALFVSLWACAVSHPYPFIRATGRKGEGRDFSIRHLPCKNEQDTGVCMFAWDCLKAEGTHLGTCIDRFYFGSCCKMKVGVKAPVHKPMDQDIHIATQMLSIRDDTKEDNKSSTQTPTEPPTQSMTDSDLLQVATGVNRHEGLNETTSEASVTPVEVTEDIKKPTFSSNVDGQEQETIQDAHQQQSNLMDEIELLMIQMETDKDSIPPQISSSVDDNQELDTQSEDLNTVGSLDLGPVTDIKYTEESGTESESEVTQGEDSETLIQENQPTSVPASEGELDISIRVPSVDESADGDSFDEEEEVSSSLDGVVEEISLTESEGAEGSQTTADNEIAQSSTLEEAEKDSDGMSDQETSDLPLEESESIGTGEVDTTTQRAEEAVMEDILVDSEIDEIESDPQQDQLSDDEPVETTPIIEQVITNEAEDIESSITQESGSDDTVSESTDGVADPEMTDITQKEEEVVRDDSEDDEIISSSTGEEGTEGTESVTAHADSIAEEEIIQQTDIKDDPEGESVTESSKTSPEEDEKIGIPEEEESNVETETTSESETDSPIDDQGSITTETSIGETDSDGEETTEQNEIFQSQDKLEEEVTEKETSVGSTGEDDAFDLKDSESTTAAIEPQDEEEMQQTLDDEEREEEIDNITSEPLSQTEVEGIEDVHSESDSESETTSKPVHEEEILEIDSQIKNDDESQTENAADTEVGETTVAPTLPEEESQSTGDDADSEDVGPPEEKSPGSEAEIKDDEKQGQDDQELIEQNLIDSEDIDSLSSSIPEETQVVEPEDSDSNDESTASTDSDSDVDLTTASPGEDSTDTSDSEMTDSESTDSPDSEVKDSESTDPSDSQVIDSESTDSTSSDGSIDSESAGTESVDSVPSDVGVEEIASTHSDSGDSEITDSGLEDTGSTDSESTSSNSTDTVSSGDEDIGEASDSSGSETQQTTPSDTESEPDEEKETSEDEEKTDSQSSDDPEATTVSSAPEEVSSVASDEGTTTDRSTTPEDEQKEETSVEVTTDPPKTSDNQLLERLANSSYKDICGQPVYPSKRIVGGSQASFGEWPWQVSLRQWRSVTYLHKCGAALVNDNWAITAAHCVENAQPDQLLLRIGEYDLERTDEPFGHVERKVQIIATHPQFDPNTFEYDVALLRFNDPVVFKPNIIPICIPEDDYDFIGDTGFVTGWGRLYEAGPLHSKLQEVDVPVVSNEECKRMFFRAATWVDVPGIMLCAGYASGKRDACEGDSGGPLVIQHKNSWKLAGVISWGIGCALPNQPGVYTRISAFREWINKIMVF